MRERGVWERDRFMGVLRARHIERSLQQVFVPYSEHTFEGDANEGLYVEHDGSGNHIVVAWDALGVVALGFDHDSDNEHDLPIEERNPGQHLESLPTELEPLAAKACAQKPRLATEAAWATRTPRPSSGSSEMLHGFDRLVEELYNAVPTPQMLEAAARLGFTAPKPAGESLALKLAQASAGGSYTMTEADEQRALTEDGAGKLDAKGVRAALKQLSAVGIEWPTLERHLAQ